MKTGNDNTPGIHLRKTIPEDFETFFTFQLDEEANYMAAFTSGDPHDKDAYMAKWAKNFANNGTSMYTIMYGDEIAGSVFSYPMDGEHQVSYWIGKAFWGKGIATAATGKFLAVFHERPLYGRVAFDNFGSMKVLTKCGFKQCSAEKFYSNVRKEEIDELVFILKD